MKTFSIICIATNFYINETICIYVKCHEYPVLQPFLYLINTNAQWYIFYFDIAWELDYVFESRVWRLDNTLS